MRSIRTLAPGAAALALIIVLAACGQAESTPPTSPSAPAAPSEAPSEAPAPSDAPSEEPSETPGSTPIEVVEHDLPMIGRVTEDGVEVRTEPRADAPLLTVEPLLDPTEPEIVLNAGDLVIAYLGPVFADGESWYEVGAADGSDVLFAFGWVTGDQIAREGAPEGQTEILVIHGQGSGDVAERDVLPGTPVTVRFAAVPMPDADECEIDVTLVGTDDLGVDVATETVSDVTIVELGPTQLSSLFQEEGGTVRLEVDTDCSFAATLIAP